MHARGTARWRRWTVAAIGAGALAGTALIGAAPATAAPEPFTYTVTSGAASGAGSLSEGLDQFEAWAALTGGEPGEARIEVAAGTTATVPDSRDVVGAAGITLTVAGGGADTSSIAVAENTLGFTGFTDASLSFVDIALQGSDPRSSSVRATYSSFTDIRFERVNAAGLWGLRFVFHTTAETTTIEDSSFQVYDFHSNGTNEVGTSISVTGSTFQETGWVVDDFDIVTVADSEFTTENRSTAIDQTGDGSHVTVTDSRFVGGTRGFLAHGFESFVVERGEFEGFDRSALDIEGDEGASIEIRDSTFLNNRIDVDSDLEELDGSMLVQRSTFVLDDPDAVGAQDDTARIRAGDFEEAALRIENSTFEVARGKAVDIDGAGATAVIEHITSVGGPIGVDLDATSTLEVRGSVFDTGTTPWIGNDGDPIDSPVTAGDVVATTPGAVTDGVSIASSAQIALGALGEHGGLTPTRVPALGSVLLDARVDAPSPDTDQRGYPRSMGTAADIGAVERVVGTASLSIDPVRVEEGGAVTATVTLTTPEGAPLDGPAAVSLATADGVAVAGTDYVTATATLEFAEPGVQTVSIATSPRDGEQGERDFAVTLTAVRDAVVADPASVQVVIVEADSPTVTPTASGSTTPGATGGQTPAPTAAGAGPLASTGAEGVLPLVGLALALVLAGAVSLGLLRRREQH